MAKVCIQVRVPMADTDGSGRIHFTALLRYMDIAEHELVRALGFPRATTFLQTAFPRVHASCDMRRAIRYDDQLSIEARVEHVGRSSWTVAFTIHYLQEVQAAGPHSETSMATGKLTIVAIDPQTERATPIPDQLRAALSGETISSEDIR